MASSARQVDHYEVLGIDVSAGDDEIRTRYRFLALAFHPDRYRRNSEHHHEAEQQIKRINEAYRVLSDPHLRAAFDASRRMYGPDLGHTRTSASIYAQSLQEMARASQRLQQVEADLIKARERLDQSERTRAGLEARLAELEQLRTIERFSSESDQKSLQEQAERAEHARQETERSLQEKLDRALRKITRLEQDLARKSASVDRLNSAKTEWESSSQGRVEMLNQRLERVRAELEEREQQLAGAVEAQRQVQEQLAQEQRTAHNAVQTYSTALSTSETEAARLQIELDALSASQVRSRNITKLWQVAAIIGIVNTLILLVLVLQWLSGN